MLETNPFKQFDCWFKEAIDHNILIPEGMTLATVDEHGHPDARVVLLKEVSQNQFIFFTNYHSHKASQLEACPQAALVFWWALLERQVRMKGKVQKVSASESDAYFKTRPRGSQIGAWASYQSKKLNDRSELESAYGDFEKRYADQEIPRPPHWGGYALIPSSFEFWQGRESRLHDRFFYDLDPSGAWNISQLSP